MKKLSALVYALVAVMMVMTMSHAYAAKSQDVSDSRSFSCLLNGNNIYEECNNRYGSKAEKPDHEQLVACKKSYQFMRSECKNKCYDEDLAINNCTVAGQVGDLKCDELYKHGAKESLACKKIAQLVKQRGNYCKNSRLDCNH